MKLWRMVGSIGCNYICVTVLGLSAALDQLEQVLSI